VRNIIKFLTRILLRVTNRKKYQAHKRPDHVCDKIILYRVWFSCNKEVSFVKMFSPSLDLVC